MSASLRYTYWTSPVGDLLLAGIGKTLHYLSFPTGSKAFTAKPGWTRDDNGLDAAKHQLTAYFAGDLRVFDVDLHLTGTPFQRRVWSALATIPFGETRSYGWLAETVGSPQAARAVGAANGANPIPIILPCHRVIGASGALTGFGGGIETKRFLLELEGVRMDKDRTERQLSLL